VPECRLKRGGDQPPNFRGDKGGGEGGGTKIIGKIRVGGGALREKQWSLYLTASYGCYHTGGCEEQTPWAGKN